MRILALLLFATTAIAQTQSTRCQVDTVSFSATLNAWRLIGCGPGFPDDLAWSLDRSDSIDGTLDGKVFRRTTGRGSVVYVCDTGVRADHQEFMRATGSVVTDGIYVAGDRCDAEHPATKPCSSPSQFTVMIGSHGTSVASVVAGRNVGIAPDATIIAVLSVGHATEWAQTLDAIVAHAWAPTTPQFRTAIINFSGGWSYYDSDKPEEKLVQQKMRNMIGGVDRDGNPDPNGKRFLFVVAAGNTGHDFTLDGRTFHHECTTDDQVTIVPAILGPSIDGLVTVGGITRDNAWWTGACGGPAIEVAGPASDVLLASTTDIDHYRGSKPDNLRNGTSFATPYVAGIAARLLELDPDLSPAELEQRLKQSPSFVSGTTLPVPVLIEEPLPRRRSVRH